MGIGGYRFLLVVSELKGLDTDELTVRVNRPVWRCRSGPGNHECVRATLRRLLPLWRGWAASAASFIAVGGADRVVMRPTAEIMVHEATSFIGGNAADMSPVVDDLDRISANLSTVYAERSGGDPAEWRDGMRAEAWFSAEEAVARRLADAVEDGRAAVAAVSWPRHQPFQVQGTERCAAPDLNRPVGAEGG